MGGKFYEKPVELAIVALAGAVAVSFHTYSASQQQEIKRIRKKYMLPTQEDKMERFRKLDTGVTKPRTTVSLIIGIISALIFGVGMCCTMDVHITKKQRVKVVPEIMRLTDELMK